MRRLFYMMVSILLLNACSENNAENINGKTFSLLPDKTYTLSFDAKENRFAGKALNNYFGSYVAKDGQITLTLAGTTMMAGPEDEMKKEQAYFQELGKIKTYTLKNKTLELKGEGITLNFAEQ